MPPHLNPPSVGAPDINAPGVPDCNWRPRRPAALTAGEGGQLIGAARALKKRLARGTPPNAPDREPLFSYRRLGRSS